MVKQRTNKGLPINLFYWRDKTGHEIDVVIDEAGKLLPIEIKSAKTYNDGFIKNISYWIALSGEKKSILLYAGNVSQKRANGLSITPWKDYFGVDEE